MRRLGWLACVAAMIASPVAAQTESTPAAPVLSVTTPRVGVSYTIKRQGTIAEGFDARLVTLTDVAVVTMREVRRANHREIQVVKEGTVMVREDDRWFCMQALSGQDEDLTRGIFCYADVDGDGRFDRRRLKRSGADYNYPPGTGLAYELRDSVEQLQPTDALKRVLVFDGYSRGQVRLRRIEFYQIPSRPESIERLRVDLPDGRGLLQVGDLTFDVRSADSDEITLVRLDGTL